MNINRTILVTILSILMTVLNLTFFEQKQIIWIGIIIVFLLLLWTMRSRTIELTKQSQILKESLKKREEREKELSNTIQDYVRLLHSLEGAIYSVDIQNGLINFSKDLEKIFGTINNELKYPFDYKQYVHPEDFTKILEFEHKLLKGHPSKVEYRVIQDESHVKWVVQKAIPIIDKNGTVSKINGHLIDITDRKTLELNLKQMAYNDDLTDLPNRKALDRHIEKTFARSKRHGHCFGIMFIDLDGFKNVNDTLGHDAGDQLLIEVASRLQDNLREEDVISRIGGDEFIVIVEESSKNELENIADRIIQSTSQPYSINEAEAKVSVSVGISLYPNDGETKEILLENADRAMYYAKNNGKNRFKFYTPDLMNIDPPKEGFIEKWRNTLHNSLFNKRK
ncbi:sensor domain-containing diguanylate cyclase [Bacillus sp. MB2021]|uniref:sensor domain-containing diguanylate cyclase n=1 Tax=Bacillus sp. MB2021 TaxID=1408303 RepID=UPI0004E1EAD6|nr:sensor domain-containing diguanylate cyclase [Bacillus sp. MB2021]